MYSAASELDIMQDINQNGSIVTKFSRTNKTNKATVNIRGVGKNGKAFVRQTIQNNTGRTYGKDYVLPEDRILELLTRANTHTLMGNLSNKERNIKMIVEKKHEQKESNKSTCLAYNK